ncbi:rhamnogalacturonate lyase [Rhizoctonia solani]|uniref:rhamnogalacturonan endolyase n=1 Tax=Rhizoctonia solani TaxID=456999 RepID=A0A8H8T2M0_9AGAM|nr:rhamnogalacturonate lyase [Rhizoctonia solani]QRW25723.1 rhamnogalacturonate lyase [Rhizoctonia solani]
MNWMYLIALSYAACVPSVLAAFGVTTGSGYLSVDTGEGWFFEPMGLSTRAVSTTNGDITSLSMVTSSAKTRPSIRTLDLDLDLQQSHIEFPGIMQSLLLPLAHYLADSILCGQLRFIARLSKSALPNGYTQSEVNGGTAIEGSDVFSTGGQTRSKFYSSVQFYKDQVHGVTGSGIGVYMAFLVMPGNAYETSSGGPFFRDINNQDMNSGHMITQPFRTGFFGPYAMVFTSGIAPSASLDTSFFSNLGLTGYVAASGRGTVKGTISGVASGFTVMVGLDNIGAQYWGIVSGTSYTITGVKPGTYTATLYKKELEVGTGSVTVTAGGTTTLNLASTESIKTNIWQIGVPDGTPSGFLNTDKIETMHPSDSRMSAWGPVTHHREFLGFFLPYGPVSIQTPITRNVLTYIPLRFINVNNPTTIKWTATSSQTGARTLRIRTTSSSPAAPTKIDSRGVTRGTWRGYNLIYEYSIPSGTLITGSNTIIITVISGSSGDTFLSPNIVYDSVELALAAFGVTKGSNYLDVDTGNKLIYRVSTTNGDITSIKYDGKELQYSKKFTQIGSGLGSATVSSKISGTTAIVTIETSTLTQYYIARSGQSALYIGTYTTLSLRSPTPSNPRGGTAIEGSDVFLVSGQTRSKFYSSVKFIDDQVHGISGSGVGAYMVIPGNAYETSSGGPFFRDINNQNSQSDDGANEVYWYMNSNHAQTESYHWILRANIDLSFFADLGLKGYVADSGRGTITGSVSGIPSGFQAVVGLKNSNAQYWAKVSGTSFSISGVKPGTYTATLFKKELEVATGSVTVSAGKSSSLTLSSTESIKTTVWQIGLPDGTPSGFLNADIHRRSLWLSSLMNNPTTIKWTASSSQIGARTLRIRTTSSFASGRPTIKVNSWSSATPAAPTKIDSRGVTRGTWRGLNQLYEYAIPAGTLVAGSNTITITVASGSSGEKFLSPNIVYDSIELY